MNLSEKDIALCQILDQLYELTDKYDKTITLLEKQYNAWGNECQYRAKVVENALPVLVHGLFKVKHELNKMLFENGVYGSQKYCH